MALIDEKKENFSNTNSKKKIHFTRLIPFSENLQQQHHMVSFNGEDLVSQHINSTKSGLTGSILDDTISQDNKYVENASFLFNFTEVDYLSFDSQPTMIVPILDNAGKDTKLEVQGPGEQGINVLIKKLVKSSGIYAIASLVNPFISLILAPFLTHHMSYNEYGALTVINTAIAFVVGITQLGLSSAFFRAYNLDYETKQDRLDILSITLILLLLITTPAAIVTSIASPWITAFLLKSSDPILVSSVRLSGVIVLLQNLTVPGLAWMRAENRATFFAGLSISNFVISLVANIILVGVFQMGINGSLIATGLGFSFMIICTIPTILRHAGLRVRWDIAKSMLSFGVPNMFSFVSIWVLQLADRTLLTHFGSLSETASYSIAYSLGSVLGVAVLSPFQLAWPSVQFTIAKRNDAAHIFQLVFRWYGIILLFTTYAFSLVAIVILNKLFPVGYRSSSPIIPVIAVSIMFYGIYSYTNVGLGVRRKTWIAVALIATGAFINVGCNIVLIPLYGSMGAALSTLIAYAVLAVFGYIVNQRIYPIPFEITRFIIALAIGITLFVSSSLFIHARLMYVTWSIDIGILCLYGGCLIILGKLPQRKLDYEDFK